MAGSRSNKKDSGHPGPQDLSETPTEEERRREPERRESVVDRRNGLDRRNRPKKKHIPDMHQRRGPGVRRSEDRRAAEEGEMTEEQWEFLQAITEYKRVNQKPFPTWTEVLDVMKKLGYQKATEDK